MKYYYIVVSSKVPQIYFKVIKVPQIQFQSFELDVEFHRWFKFRPILVNENILLKLFTSPYRYLKQGGNSHLNPVPMEFSKNSAAAGLVRTSPGPLLKFQKPTAAANFWGLVEVRFLLIFSFFCKFLKKLCRRQLLRVGLNLKFGALHFILRWKRQQGKFTFLNDFTAFGSSFFELFSWFLIMFRVRNNFLNFLFPSKIDKIEILIINYGCLNTLRDPDEVLRTKLLVDQ